MKREKLLTISVIALLILNFGMLGFMLLNKNERGHGKPHRGNPRADMLIMETLHLSPEQEAQFEELKHEHHRNMVELDAEYRGLLQQYFELLQSDTYPASQKDSLEKAMANTQAQKASVTYQHFKDIKTMCNAQQQQDFDTLVPELIKILLLPPKDLPPPRRD